MDMNFSVGHDFKEFDEFRAKNFSKLKNKNPKISKKVTLDTIKNFLLNNSIRPYYQDSLNRSNETDPQVDPMR